MGMSLWCKHETSLILLGLSTLSLCAGNVTLGGQDRGMVSNSLEELGMTTYWWGEWTKWGGCTRTCGTGVMSQERHCLKQRNIQNPLGQLPDSVSPSVLIERKKTGTGEGITNTCTGNAKQYRLCNTEECPFSGRSFREEQCSSFNSQVYNGRRYCWKPLYPDDYVHISSNPCDLHCTTVDGERQLMVFARDGTLCKSGDYRGVCIGGKCEPVGCDGVLFSSHMLDKCGVCQGDGSSCRRVTGSFRQVISSSGYTFVTRIPQGSWDIQVIERKKSANLLAVSDQAGRFFFNGAYRVDSPQNFQAAGTTFKYRRPMDMQETGIEYIVAKGPINQPVNVLVWNQNAGIPFITYEYTVLRSPLLAVPQVPLHLVKDTVADPVDGISTHILDKDLFEADQNHILHQEAREETAGNWKETVTNEVYEETAPVQSKQEALAPSYDAVRQNSNQSSLLSARDFLDGRPSKERSDNLIWNILLEKAAGAGEVHINFSTNQLLFQGHTLHLGDFLVPDVPVRHHDAPFSLNSSVHQHNAGIQGNDTGLLLLLNKTLLPGFQSANHSNHTRSHQRFLQKTFGLSTADMYRWKVSSQEPCSISCSTGVARSFAICVRYDGVEVDNNYCDTLTRPEPVHEFCIGRECQPRWETNSWSECSQTCGEGFQFRAARCWKMLSPGLDSSVYSDLCTLAHLERPLEQRACKNPTCGPQWEEAQWTECTAKCGNWSQVTRDVRCSEEEHMCNVSTRPPSVKNCTGPPCKRQWTVSEWGPCSGPCRQGTMVRHVYCKTPDGHVVPEVQCPAESRPLAIQPCGSPECPPHWVAQDWERCNTTCGRGTKRRIILCAGITGGMFRTYDDGKCVADERPPDETTCFERPCFKWYTTPWSECTKTCGVGMRSRDVKCYQGRKIVKGCDPLTKPSNKQACPLEPCPTQQPDENCKDQPRTNCSLALRVNLCNHWYYSKACCLSCRGMRPP